MIFVYTLFLYYFKEWWSLSWQKPIGRSCEKKLRKLVFAKKNDVFVNKKILFVCRKKIICKEEDSFVGKNRFCNQTVIFMICNNKAYLCHNQS